MILVKKFCFCCALPTGSLTIGLIQAGLNLLTILILVITIAMSELIKTYNDSVTQQQQYDNNFNSNTKSDSSSNSNSNYNHVIGLYLTNSNFYIFIFIKFIYLITSILLIVSVLAKKYKVLMLPYVVLEGLYLMVVLLLWIAIGFNINDWYTARVFLLFGLYFGVNVYFWICVLSHYLILIEIKRQHRINAFLMERQSLHHNSQHNIEQCAFPN